MNRAEATRPGRGPILGRWAAGALTALLPSGLNLLGVGLLWVVVLRGEGPSGAALAAGITVAALLAHYLLYAVL